MVWKPKKVGFLSGASRFVAKNDSLLPGPGQNNILYWLLYSIYCILYIVCKDSFYLISSIVIKSNGAEHNCHKS